MNNVITLDFETYYAPDYSLSKMTTEEYVRDPRFEVIGLGVHMDGRNPLWLTDEKVELFLKTMDWSDKFILCQNTAFDGAILKWHYGVGPKGWLDTLAMSRALFPHEMSHALSTQAKRADVGIKGDEVMHALGKRRKDFTTFELARYGNYCRNDVLLTRKLFDIYAPGFPLSELKLIDLTLRMFIDARLSLDADLLVQHLKETRERKAQLIDAVRDRGIESADPDFIHAVFSAPDGEWLKKVLMSNDRFAEMLLSAGVVPPRKVSPTTGRSTYAFAKTDEEFLALKEHPDLFVQALVAGRLGVKTTLEETRTERFIGMASRGAFPVPLRYYGAHSGRWSGQDSVNLQNLPSRGKGVNTLKRAILPPPGHVFIDCDSAQIEARTLAWLAGQTDLVAAFMAKQDVYKMMACRIYGLQEDQIDKPKRDVGKTVILGAGYGVGAAKLQAFLKLQAKVEVSLDEAQRIVTAYRNTYNMIPRLWRSGETALRALMSGNGYIVDVPGVLTANPEKGGIRMPNGMHILYPDLGQNSEGQWEYTSKGKTVKLYSGKVVENLTQGLARIIIGEQMLRIAKRYKPVLTVHDAIGIVAPIEEGDEARAYVEECMSWCPPWATGLPLACESGMGASYGDC